MAEQQLPEGWLKIKAADSFSAISTVGKSVKTKDCLKSGVYPVIDQGKEEVSGYFNDPEKAIRVESPLILFGDHTKIIKWIVVDFVPGADGTKILKSLPFLAPRFAYYQLRSLEIPDRGYSRHFQFLKDIDFFVPPLAEQQVIADTLDRLLAQVERSKARLQRIPQLLKRFRQSVLAAAVSGKLTEEWRGTECFEANQNYLSEIIKESKVGLIRSSLEQLMSPSINCSTPYIKMNNIDNDWGVNLNEIVYVQCNDEEIRNYALNRGDWLFNTRNSKELVGKSCVWRQTGNFVYNNNILRLRLKDDYLPDYLEIWFRSFAGRESLNRIKSATTSVAAIYQKQLMAQVIGFPKLEEQTEIVRRVEQLFAYADRIEQQAQAALARVNHLTQAILAKAFRGELSEQWRRDNPHLISGDHSATALLARIQAERAKAPAKGRGRKSNQSQQG